MRKMLISCFFLFHLSWLPANGDIVRLNIGDSWRNPIKVNWIGVMEEIDPQSNLATFYYYVDNREYTFEVHVSRIYSIVFNSQAEMRENFPEGVSGHKNPLPVLKSNDRQRGILLDNRDGRAAELLPEDVRIWPSRENPDVKVYGVIASADEENVILILYNKRDKTTSVTVRRDMLKTWIRG